MAEAARLFSRAADKFDAALDIDPQVGPARIGMHLVESGAGVWVPLVGCHLAFRLFRASPSRPRMHGQLPLLQTLCCTAAQPVQKVEAFRLGGQSLLDAGLCMAGYDAAEAKQLVKVGC